MLHKWQAEAARFTDAPPPAEKPVTAPVESEPPPVRTVPPTTAPRIALTPRTFAAFAAQAQDKAPAKPAQPRKLLVFTLTKGFSHDSIPIASEAVKILGAKTGVFQGIAYPDYPRRSANAVGVRMNG